MYETFDHTADLGLRARAADLPSLFAEAARGLFSMFVADLDTVREERQVTFRIDGRQPDYLLFDWLSELLAAFELKKLLLRRFEVRIDAEGLSADAWGEEHDSPRHALEHEVKAITYHGLKVERQPDGGWLAEVIVDI